MTSAATLYHSVIQDVITNVRDAFQDEAIDESVLMELKTLWETKLVASKTIEQAAKPVPPSQVVAANQSHASNGMQASGPSSHGQQVLVTDPTRLMPVQITIPAQPGHPNSAPKALTVQVPAHALQQGTPSSAILQQVLTQAITQALNLTDSNQAAMFLQTHINSAFKLN